MAKKYFWLKLKEDFFQQKTIKKLRKIAGGDTYTIIYLKLQLLSIKDEGKLYFDGVEDSFIEELALVLDENIENIKVTLLFLESNYLIEILDKDEYFLPEAKNSIGSESDSAIRMRRHRENKLKASQSDEQTSQCYMPVTNCYTEIDIEIDIDKDIYNSQDNITNLDRPISNPVLKQELSLIIGDLKLNIDELIKLNKPVTRIKDVIEWCKANGKGEGYMFKAIKEGWNLQEHQAVDKKKTNKDKTQEIKELMRKRREKREKNGT